MLWAFFILGVQFSASRGLYVEVVLMTDEQKEKITALRHEVSGYTVIENSPGISKDTDKSVYTLALGRRDFKYHRLISIRGFLSAVLDTHFRVRNKKSSH